MTSAVANISLSDYLNQNFSNANFDSEYINEWNSRSFFAQMLDAWGEMNYTLQSFENNDSEETILQHLKSLHDVCCLFYNNPNNFDGEKESLKIAEWEFNNFVTGKTKDRSCIKWFNQWNNDINFDLV